MNPPRQNAPSPEQLEALNAKRPAEGLPEIPSCMFEEVGLTIDEIPEDENPWRDPRYVTQIVLPYGGAGQVIYFKVPRINVPNYHNLFIYTSGLLSGLSGKALMTVWTLWEKLLERSFFEQTKDEDAGYRRSMSSYSHSLARVRETVGAMTERLEDLKGKITELGGLFLFVTGLGKAFDKAIDSLHELIVQARKEPTVGEADLFHKRMLSAEWISDRPAIAYAVDTIFREHSSPPLKVSEIRQRIAAFENKFLQANVDSGGASVAREISRFKENPERARIMDGLIEELVTSDWYVWPPETATDEDARDEQTESPMGNKNPEDRSQSGQD